MAKNLILLTQWQQKTAYYIEKNLKTCFDNGFPYLLYFMFSLFVSVSYNVLYINKFQLFAINNYDNKR